MKENVQAQNKMGTGPSSVGIALKEPNAKQRPKARRKRGPALTFLQIKQFNGDSILVLSLRHAHHCHSSWYSPSQLILPATPLRKREPATPILLFLPELLPIYSGSIPNVPSAWSSPYTPPPSLHNQLKYFDEYPCKLLSLVASLRRYACSPCHR